MNYNEIVNYIGNKKSFHRPDCLRMVFESFDFEIDPAKVIIVAGTNGKGTTCAVLQTLLYEAGKNVGFFSSPHLEKINERIKYNCVDVSDEEFCDLFFKVHEVVQDYDLSFFEYLTFMAVYHFFVSHKNDIDFAIFEVGLGGTLDSTNIIPHNTSVIAALGMDHTHILGNSLLDIAANKFGIISENNTVFHLKFTDKIKELAHTYIAEKSARFIEAYDCSMRVDTSRKDPLFFISTPFGEFKLPLPGMRAMENTALAITVFHNLVENAEKYMSAVEKTYWPGRMEKVYYRQAASSSASQARTIYLSGDHNVQGIDSLLVTLPYYVPKQDKTHFVVGICRGKDHEAMLSKLIDFPGAKLYLTETPVKTLKIQEYSKHFLEAATYVNANPQVALEAAVANAADDDLIVVTGSLYLVGLIRSLCSSA